MINDPVDPSVAARVARFARAHAAPLVAALIALILGGTLVSRVAHLEAVIGVTDAAHTAAHRGKYGANVDHSTTTIHGGHSLVTPGDSLGGFQSGADKTAFDREGHVQRGYVDAVSTSNQATLTGLAQTIDGVALSSANMRVWLPAQTTTTADGCYVTASGAWTRCPEFPTGLVADGSYFIARSGTSNKGIWAVTNTNGAVVGTNDITSASIVSGGGTVSSVFGRTGAVVAATGDYTIDQITGSAISVLAASTSPLPTGTYSNGTAGVGATYTVTANGACPTLDNITVTTNDVVMTQNGTTENGVYVVTAAGSGGSQCVLTRDARLDQAAEIPGSVISVKQGRQSSGATYRYKAVKAVTMGTTSLFWKRTDSGMGPNEGIRCSDDFVNEVAPTINAASGPCGFQTTSNTGTVALLSNNATAGVIGEYAFSTNTGTTSYIGVSESGGGTNLGGQALLGTNVDVEDDFRWQSPVASDGTNTYANMIGLVNVLTVGAKLPLNGIAFVTDNTSAVSTTNILAVTAAGGVSTGSVIDTGVTNTAATRYRGHISHDAGDTDWRFYLNGSLVATLNTNITTTTLGLQMVMYKSAGASATNGLATEFMAKDHFYPQRRAP